MMNKFVIHTGGTNIIRFDNPTTAFLNILCDDNTYSDGYTVAKLTEGDAEYFQLLRGSKLAQQIKEGGRYGYEHSVAYKIGKIAGDRFKNNPNEKTTVIKTKINLMGMGNHATHKKMYSCLRGGVYSKFRSDDIIIYSIEDGFLFVNATEPNNNLTPYLSHQTISSLITAYYPHAKRIS